MERPSSPLTTWRCPRQYRNYTQTKTDNKREKKGIIAVGDSIPPLIKKLKSMGFPRAIIKALKKLNIRRLTPIQMQALPAILLYRNVLMISLQRSGKSLCYILPIILGSFEEEKRLPLQYREGPVGLIIVPSRELALQLSEFIENLLSALLNFPRIRTLLCIGGLDMRTQRNSVKSGFHILIATPGRLSELLAKQQITLSFCKTIVLDEADRLLDSGFEEEITSILAQASREVQLVLSSAVLPRKIQEFRMKNPIYISIDRTRLRDLNFTQEFEFIPLQSKAVKLLEVLAKTEPPVLVFCENKPDAHFVCNYLSSRAINSQEFHGGKTQQERLDSLRKFRTGDCFVLVATDFAARGLTFHGVQHIVNYDTPKDIEGYLQRISRLGDKGMVTSFINQNTNKAFLCPLRAYLQSNGYPVPHQLRDLYDTGDPQTNSIGQCAHCNLPGHGKFICKSYQEYLLKSFL